MQRWVTTSLLKPLIGGKFKSDLPPFKSSIYAKSWWTPWFGTSIDTFWRNLILTLKTFVGKWFQCRRESAPVWPRLLFIEDGMRFEQTKLQSPGINMGQVFKQESVYVTTAHLIRNKLRTVNRLLPRDIVSERSLNCLPKRSSGNP